jgi:phosphate transport system permease protein
MRLRPEQLQRLLARHHLRELVFEALGLLLMLLAMIVLGGLFLRLLLDGLPRLSLEFLLDYPSRHAAGAGLLPAWVGSLLLMAVTVLAAVPIGVAAAVYLEEFAARSRWSGLIEVNVANLAGVPSIVYGLLALGLFAQRLHLGESLLAAGLALALLVLPIVIVSAREALRAVPRDIREAAYGLGASRWQTVRHHVLPYASAGILTGIILGVSRAIGETAPLIMLGALSFIAFLPPSPFTAEPPFVSFDWLHSPFVAMPTQIFNWLSRPDGGFHANAAAGAVVLILMTLALNALAIWLRLRARRRLQW